ncbi:MAG: pilus assembly protein [Candidatus Nealsonbacteria bacterium]|nr:pilus assembly protein [Candidatus Nealsonbacteria bacterium]
MYRQRRRGVQTLELVIALVVLIVLFVAGIQFGTTMIVEQAVTHAATVGAREAGKGAPIDELALVVERILAPHVVHVGSCASVVLEDPSAAAPVQQAGTLPCDPPSEPALESGEVRVTVAIDLSRRPFLNALAAFGISSRGKQFTVSSVVHREDTDIALESDGSCCGG